MKSEALLTVWDPIPACVYYGLQVPARLVLRLVIGSRKVVLNTVHFSNDKPIEYHFSTNNNNSKKSLSTFSSIPEEHKNGRVNGEVRTNGCATNVQIPNGDLIQL
jgi:hypothetical protein